MPYYRGTDRLGSWARAVTKLLRMTGFPTEIAVAPTIQPVVVVEDNAWEYVSNSSLENIGAASSVLFNLDSKYEYEIYLITKAATVNACAIVVKGAAGNLQTLVGPQAGEYALVLPFVPLSQAANVSIEQGAAGDTAIFCGWGYRRRKIV